MSTESAQNWGKRHWGFFIYCVLRAVDYKGRLDTGQMTLDGQAHPTKLKDGTVIGNHSEMDCLDDFERWGLLENIGTGINPVVRISDRGWEWAKHVLRQKAEGLQYNQCSPPEECAEI